MKQHVHFENNQQQGCLMRLKIRYTEAVDTHEVLAALESYGEIFGFFKAESYAEGYLLITLETNSKDALYIEGVLQSIREVVTEVSDSAEFYIVLRGLLVKDEEE